LSVDTGIVWMFTVPLSGGFSASFALRVVGHGRWSSLCEG
jgi:hypothetical protein